jgi:hypothetical protein
MENTVEKRHAREFSSLGPSPAPELPKSSAQKKTRKRRSSIDKEQPQTKVARVSKKTRKVNTEFQFKASM